MVFDENPKITDNEKLPVSETLKVLRYKTIKKNNTLGWWSAVVLLEDHDKKQACFYRWRKRGDVWKRDKKIAFRTKEEWSVVKDALEDFVKELEK
jgi:hypothetical protein